MGGEPIVVVVLLLLLFALRKLSLNSLFFDCNSSIDCCKEPDLMYWKTLATISPTTTTPRIATVVVRLLPLLLLAPPPIDIFLGEYLFCYTGIYCCSWRALSVCVRVIVRARTLVAVRTHIHAYPRFDMYIHPIFLLLYLCRAFLSPEKRPSLSFFIIINGICVARYLPAKGQAEIQVALLQKYSLFRVYARRIPTCRLF